MKEKPGFFGAIDSNPWRVAQKPGFLSSDSEVLMDGQENKVSLALLLVHCC